MKRQSGITLIGFVIILIILAFFGYTAMKLVPPYIEYMGVVKAMNQVASEPDTAASRPTRFAQTWVSRAVSSTWTMTRWVPRPSTS